MVTPKLLLFHLGHTSNERKIMKVCRFDTKTFKISIDCIMPYNTQVVYTILNHQLPIIWTYTDRHRQVDKDR